jgi:hypothetical protein
MPIYSLTLRIVLYSMVFGSSLKDNLLYMVEQAFQKKMKRLFFPSCFSGKTNFFAIIAHFHRQLHINRSIAMFAKKSVEIGKESAELNCIFCCFFRQFVSSKFLSGRTDVFGRGLSEISHAYPPGQGFVE